MRYLIISIIILTLCQCTNENDNVRNTSQQQLSPEDSIVLTKVFKNDTVCLDHLEKYSNLKIELIKACYIMYSDSLSNEFSILYGNNELPFAYNFEVVDKNLIFTKTNDTIDLRLLILNDFIQYSIIPDMIYMHGDTLFIDEKTTGMENSRRTGKFKFQETYYRFILKNRYDSLIIREKAGK